MLYTVAIRPKRSTGAWSFINPDTKMRHDTTNGIRPLPRADALALASDIRSVVKGRRDGEAPHVRVVPLTGLAGKEKGGPAEIRVRKLERTSASPQKGMDQSWTEWQVMIGRRVWSRHDFEHQAQAKADQLIAERRAKMEDATSGG